MAENDWLPWQKCESRRRVLSGLQPEVVARLALKWTEPVLAIWSATYPDDKRLEAAVEAGRLILDGKGPSREVLDSLVKSAEAAMAVAGRSADEQAKTWRITTGDWLCGPYAQPFIAAEHAAKAASLFAEVVAQACRPITNDRSWTFVVAANLAGECCDAAEFAAYKCPPKGRSHDEFIASCATAQVVSSAVFVAQWRDVSEALLASKVST